MAEESIKEMLRTFIPIKVSQKVRLAYIRVNSINSIMVWEQLFTSAVAMLTVLKEKRKRTKL